MSATMEENALRGTAPKVSYNTLYGKYAEHARKSDYESLQTNLDEVSALLKRAINLGGYLRDDSSGREYAKMTAILLRIKAADTRIKAAQRALEKAKVARFNRPIAGQGGSQKPQRLETEALRTTADRCADLRGVNYERATSTARHRNTCQRGGATATPQKLVSPGAVTLAVVRRGI